MHFDCRAKKARRKSIMEMPFGSGVAGLVAESGHSMTIPEAQSCKHFDPGIELRLGCHVHNILSCPVRDVSGKQVAVLEVKACSRDADKRCCHLIGHTLYLRDLAYPYLTCGCISPILRRLCMSFTVHKFAITKPTLFSKFQGSSMMDSQCGNVLQAVNKRDGKFSDTDKHLLQLISSFLGNSLTLSRLQLSALCALCVQFLCNCHSQLLKSMH